MKLIIYLTICMVFLVTISSAVFCAISRVVLNLFDRSFFRKDHVDFLKGILFNALYPLFFSIISCLLFHNFDSSILKLINNPGVILSGFGAQFAAYSCSKCLRGMNIRNVMLSSKTSDFFIPIIVFFATSEFRLSDYLFINLTTLAFIPIALTVFKEGRLYEYSSYLFMSSLVLQALINSYFHISDYAQSWDDFSKLMVGILFWRAFLILFSVMMRYFRNPSMSFQPLNFKILISLFFRGALAFFSQAAFFFSITREMSFIAWPILNSTPILSCYAAHYFLKEKVGRSESRTLFLFILIFCVYFLIRGYL